MSLKYVTDAPNAPKAIGPYSQAVVAGGLVFISGQIPLDPQSGQMAEGIDAQANQVMSNLKAILSHLELDFGHVVKTNISLTDMGHFQTVNAFYEKWLGSFRPARATVQVAALPKGAQVEIEMTAVVG